jgi:hypothetical protein
MRTVGAKVASGSRRGILTRSASPHCGQPALDFPGAFALLIVRLFRPLGCKAFPQFFDFGDSFPDLWLRKILMQPFGKPDQFFVQDHNPPFQYLRCSKQKTGCPSLTLSLPAVRLPVRRVSPSWFMPRATRACVWRPTVRWANFCAQTAFNLEEWLEAISARTPVMPIGDGFGGLIADFDTFQLRQR